MKGSGRRKNVFLKKKLDILQHPLEETDHLGVRIFGNGILNQSSIDNYEPVRFPLVYPELEVLVRGVEFLRVVIHSLNRARVVTGTVDNEQRVSKSADVLCRCRVVRITPRIREAIKATPAFTSSTCGRESIVNRPPEQNPVRPIFDALVSGRGVRQPLSGTTVST